MRTQHKQFCFLDDPNWWQARLAEESANEPAKLIPSRELEEKRKAYVRPEANYTMKIGLCGSLTSRKKKKGLFKSKSNTEFDKAELSLYEEVTLMKPFRRKTLVLIGASGSSRRSLKHRILNADPDQVFFSFRRLSLSILFFTLSLGSSMRKALYYFS